MILIAYDGSKDAQSAIELAGQLIGGEPATVLSAWEPFVDVMARTGLGIGPGVIDFEAIDKASEERAGELAAEGAQRAARAGVIAQVRTRATDATIAATILAEADELGASAIVLGSRGLTGIKSLLLGRVSHAVLQHADRPVIVIPSSEVAHERAAHGR